MPIKDANLGKEKVKSRWTIFDLEEKSEEKEIPKLKKKKFFLDRLVFDKAGPFGYIIPILLTIALIIVGFVLGIYSSPGNPGVEPAAQGAYTFWVLFILFGTYLLNWFVWAIMEVMKEANERLDIKKETHDRIIKLMFGWFGIIMSILIALPFILYDITGFGTGEGWINDIKLYHAEKDDSWYPRISQTENGIGAGSILWLLIWIIPWLYFGAFVWLSIVFLYYINITLKMAPWRDNITKVIYDRQHKRLLNLSIACYFPLAPYLVIKLIFQVFYLPWWSDTIGTFVLFALFIGGVILSPILISNDIKYEKKNALIKLHNYGYEFFEDVARDTFLGKIRPAEDVSRAILLHMYNDDMYEELSKKVLDSALIKKITIAALAPIISYMVKVFLAGGGLF